MKSRKFPKKKVSRPPGRHTIEIVERKHKPVDLNKPFPHNSYWGDAAKAAKEDPKQP